MCQNGFGQRVFILFTNNPCYPNPMTAQQPRSTTPTAISITCDGYRTMERVVIFDDNKSLQFEMSRGRGVDRQATTEVHSDPHHDPHDGVYRGRQGHIAEEW